MKVAIIAMLFAAPAFAQGQSAGLPAACGPGDVSFKVKLDDSQHTLTQPEPGKALVYFIQDKGPAVLRHWWSSGGQDWVGWSMGRRE
jgi:hypothetical protein